MLAVTDRVPTRVLWGGRDPYIPSRYAYRFGTKDVRIFPCYGHWLPLEAPQQVTQELTEFFD